MASVVVVDAVASCVVSVGVVVAASSGGHNGFKGATCDVGVGDGVGVDVVGDAVASLLFSLLFSPYHRLPRGKAWAKFEF